MSSVSGQNHGFDILIAAKYGVEEAILIHHFMHWVRINHMAKRHIIDGRAWTYNTRKEISLNFPYWNFDKVKYLCEKLVEMGVLMTGNFNQKKFDRTLWYAFVDEEEFKVDLENSKIFYDVQNVVFKEKFTKGKSALCKGKIAPAEGKSAQPIPDSLSSDTLTTDKDTQEGDAPVGACMRAFGKFVKMTDQEYNDLCMTHSHPVVKDMIQQINDYLASTGKKPYKDYAAAIRNWIRRRNEKGLPTSKPVSNQDFMNKVKERFESRSDMYFGPDGITFSGGASQIIIKLVDFGFRDQVLNRLRKMNLYVEGL